MGIHDLLLSSPCLSPPLSLRTCVCSQFAECIADCDTAVEKGREVHADYKTIAKALTRKGTALAKMAKTAADYDPAIAAFNKVRGWRG